MEVNIPSELPTQILQNKGGSNERIFMHDCALSPLPSSAIAPQKCNMYFHLLAIHEGESEKYIHFQKTTWNNHVYKCSLDK